jgi:hypothetical protein
VDIPDDPDPHRAALAIYRAVHPTAAAELRERIAGDGRAIEDLVDTARTRAELHPVHFVRRAAMLIRRRNDLEARLATIEGTSPRARPSPEAEIFNLIGSVRRWRDLEVLRVERQAWIARLHRELDEVGLTIRQVADSHRAIHAVRVADASDLWLEKMTRALERRASLKERLAALGDDREARARTITAVVGVAGELAVVESVAPKMLSPDFSASRIKHALEDADARLSRLDPDSRAYKQLTADRQELQDSLQDARDRAEAHRTDLARRLVQEASGGSLEHITMLSQHVSDPELSRALAAARGGDDVLISTVAELMGERQP